MPLYSIDRISAILHAAYLQKANTTDAVEHLQIDSRRIIHPQTTLFFALQTARRNGHDFIKECYTKGVRNFVVHEKIIVTDFTDANFLLVDNTLTALQQLAAFHRSQFTIPVIGITRQRINQAIWGN